MQRVAREPSWETLRIEARFRIARRLETWLSRVVERVDWRGAVIAVARDWTIVARLEGMGRDVTWKKC